MQHWFEVDSYFNLFSGLMMRAMGFIKAHQLGPGWIKQIKPDPAQVAGILDLDFENVLPSHGGAVIGGAREKYRPAVEAYVGR